MAWTPNYSEMTSKALVDILTDSIATEEEQVAARYELESRGHPTGPAGIPEDIQAIAARPTPPVPPVPQSSGGSTVGYWILPGALMFWLIYVLWWGPNHAASSPTWPQKCTMYTELYLTFPDAFPRVEQLQAQNIDIYMQRKEFEKVAYPDRTAAVKNVGKTWDDHTHWYFFSSVQIRDIQTGKVLANYSCNTGRVELKTDGWF